MFTKNRVLAAAVALAAFVVPSFFPTTALAEWVRACSPKGCYLVWQAPSVVVSRPRVHYTTPVTVVDPITVESPVFTTRGTVATAAPARPRVAAPFRFRNRVFAPAYRVNAPVVFFAY
jgi:hypothetical protein